MVAIRIIAVGTVKEKYLKDGINEYLKRLSAYAKVEIIETREERIPENLSEAEKKTSLQKEGDGILRNIREKSYVTVLDIEGREMSSEQLAGQMEDLPVWGRSEWTFVIGGSLGLAPEVKRRADCRLSFSPMTFPHQLMRLILLEQIYRGFKIIRKEPYHK